MYVSYRTPCQVEEMHTYFRATASCFMKDQTRMSFEMEPIPGPVFHGDNFVKLGEWRTCFIVGPLLSQRVGTRIKQIEDAYEKMKGAKGVQSWNDQDVETLESHAQRQGELWRDFARRLEEQDVTGDD